jgi:hypothetical protein
VVLGGPGELRKKGSGDVIILSNLGHLAVDALVDPNVFDDFDTGVRISIVASGKLHRATSGRWWRVTNHDDSGLHHHPTTTRGFTETVNWNLKRAGKFTGFWLYERCRAGSTESVIKRNSRSSTHGLIIVPHVDLSSPAFFANVFNCYPGVRGIKHGDDAGELSTGVGEGCESGGESL